VRAPKNLKAGIYKLSVAFDVGSFGGVLKASKTVVVE